MQPWERIFGPLRGDHRLRRRGTFDLIHILEWTQDPEKLKPQRKKQDITNWRPTWGTVKNK